ncbi:sigma-54 interaction domain-containing protein [Photobacterium alginatilyticum]|nr:sigma-54 dependent transcriptional regulator [Photobacterium alginatilyticum]
MKQDKNASISAIALRGPVFDKIVILASSWEDDWFDYKDWLKKKLAVSGRPHSDISVIRARIVSPIDYSSITKVMQKKLNEVGEVSDMIYINLTSGTPAMTTISVLLGKGVGNCMFLQSSPHGDIDEVEIPVDFAAEYGRASGSGIYASIANLPKSESAFEKINATSQIMRDVIKKAQRLASSDLPALILGETGTGKEVMANAIHKASPRSGKPFRAVNCGALPESLVDSILFGHVKGAFTGAQRDHAGLFEQANGGTLFLDEVGELPLNIQVKLLRALQQKEITRVGDTAIRDIDVRIIAATHRDLFTMISSGDFREDLFYRLAVGVIHIPPLRERIDDIPDLVESLLNDINQQATTHPQFGCKKISSSAIKFTASYDWPGNIRELWNTLHRAVLWSEQEVLDGNDIKSAILSRSGSNEANAEKNSFEIPGDLSQFIDSIKKSAIESALEKSAGNKSMAARLLGLNNHQTLNNWIKSVNLEP